MLEPGGPEGEPEGAAHEGFDAWARDLGGGGGGEVGLGVEEVEGFRADEEREERGEAETDGVEVADVVATGVEPCAGGGEP